MRLLEEAVGKALELEVATLLSMAIGVLPRAITAWHVRHPDIGIRMIEYTHRTLLEEDVRRSGPPRRVARPRRAARRREARRRTAAV